MLNKTRSLIFLIVFLMVCLCTNSIVLAAGETSSASAITPPAAQFTSYIPGASCKDYIKSLAEGKEKGQAAYILGAFVTGVNFAKARETKLTLPAMTAIVEQYCRANPDKLFITSLVALEKVLRQENQKPASPTSLEQGKGIPGTSIQARPAAAALVTAPTLPPEKKEGEYVVQVISTQDPVEAATTFERLKVKKLPVYQENVDFGSKGVWLRIIIGPYSDKPSANKVAKELKKEKFACIVRPR